LEGEAARPRPGGTAPRGPGALNAKQQLKCSPPTRPRPQSPCARPARACRRRASAAARAALRAAGAPAAPSPRRAQRARTAPPAKRRPRPTRRRPRSAQARVARARARVRLAPRRPRPARAARPPRSPGRATPRPWAAAGFLSPQPFADSSPLARSDGVCQGHRPQRRRRLRGVRQGVLEWRRQPHGPAGAAPRLPARPPGQSRRGAARPRAAAGGVPPRNARGASAPPPGRAPHPCACPPARPHARRARLPFEHPVCTVRGSAATNISTRTQPATSTHACTPTLTLLPPPQSPLRHTAQLHNVRPAQHDCEHRLNQQRQLQP
jgi:hypothetical protein